MAEPTAHATVDAPATAGGSVDPAAGDGPVSNGQQNSGDGDASAAAGGERAAAAAAAVEQQQAEGESSQGAAEPDTRPTVLIIGGLGMRPTA